MLVNFSSQYKALQNCAPRNLVTVRIKSRQVYVSLRHQIQKLNIIMTVNTPSNELCPPNKKSLFIVEVKPHPHLGEGCCSKSFTRISFHTSKLVSNSKKPARYCTARVLFTTQKIVQGFFWKKSTYMKLSSVHQIHTISHRLTWNQKSFSMMEGFQKKFCSNWSIPKFEHHIHISRCSLRPVQEIQHLERTFLKQRNHQLDIMTWLQGSKVVQLITLNSRRPSTKSIPCL